MELKKRGKDMSKSALCWSKERVILAVSLVIDTFRRVLYLSDFLILGVYYLTKIQCPYMLCPYITFCWQNAKTMSDVC